MKPHFIATLPTLAAALIAAGGAQAQSPSPPRDATWAGYPRMVLERTYAGPLQDTIIERWRDPIDGDVCFLYLPITAQHSAPTANGFVQYGANVIGSISCVPGPPQRAGTPPANR
jgi:hypothetical protein